MFPVPWSSRRSWSLHLFLGRPMFLHPFVLYCSACFGSLFVSILCTCCSYFSWYSFISFTMFCAPVFCLIHWYFSLSSFVNPSRCLKNFICAASKRCSSLFFSTQTLLPNFNAAFAVQNIHFMFNYFLFRKSCRLWDNVEKYCTAGQATDDNIIRRMRIACWTNNVTNARSEYITLVTCHLQQWCHQLSSNIRFYVHCLWAW